MGKGSGGGGDGPDAAVTNQQLLVLPRNALCELTDEQRRAICIVELRFARDVAVSAAAAYEEILNLVETRAADLGADGYPPQ